MFNKKLKEEIRLLSNKIKELEKEFYFLNNPPKFKIGDKVESKDQSYTIIDIKKNQGNVVYSGSNFYLYGGSPYSYEVICKNFIKKYIEEESLVYV